MQDRLSWAQAACARVLRPVIRLALGLGLKHPHLEELLRNLLLAEAQRVWRAKGVSAPNISQLAITTGLNRKDVTARLRDAQADALPHTDLSAAAKTFTRWLQLATEDASLSRLPIAQGMGGTLSFEQVAREASRGDVHHRSVLDELIRLGMCRRDDGHVELAAEGFVPSSDLQSTLAFLGDNLRDHASAAVSNALGEAPLFLERAVFADGLSAEDCEALHQRMRQRWAAMHRDLVAELGDAVERSDGAGPKRARVGVYVYYEDAAETPRDAPAGPAAAAPGDLA